MAYMKHSVTLRVEGVGFLGFGGWVWFKLLGFGDFVARARMRVAILITTYNPNSGTYTLTCYRCHDPPSRGSMALRP